MSRDESRIVRGGRGQKKKAVKGEEKRRGGK